MTHARGEDGVHRGTVAAVVSAVVVHSERYIYIYTTLFAKIGSRIKTEERKTLTNN